MATLTTAGVTFGDSTVQTTAYPGIPADGAIGSIQGFLCTFGTSQLAGATISGSYLFRASAIGTAQQAFDNTGASAIYGGRISVGTYGTTGSLINRTTAWTVGSGTGLVTQSPTTGTWRLLTPNVKGFFIGGCETTTVLSTVLVIRVS